MKTSEGLDKTLEVLYDRGWTKHSFQNAEGVCLRGAARIAIHGKITQSTQSVWAIESYLFQAIPGAESLSRWNDEPARTFDEIVEVIERAKKLALIDEENHA